MRGSLLNLGMFFLDKGVIFSLLHEGTGKSGPSDRKPSPSLLGRLGWRDPIAKVTVTFPKRLENSVVSECRVKHWSLFHNVPMYIYIYIIIYIHTRIYIYTHVYMHICMCDLPGPLIPTARIEYKDRVADLRDVRTPALGSLGSWPASIPPRAGKTLVNGWWMAWWSFCSFFPFILIRCIFLIVLYW